MAARCSTPAEGLGAAKQRQVAAAQRAFAHRAEMNGLATLGKWQKDLEKKAA